MTGLDGPFSFERRGSGKKEAYCRVPAFGSELSLLLFSVYP